MARLHCEINGPGRYNACRRRILAPVPRHFFTLFFTLFIMKMTCAGFLDKIPLILV